jgi:hypothetical protein
VLRSPDKGSIAEPCHGSPSTFSAPASLSRQFWPNFVVPAVAVPAMWLLLHGLIGPDGVIMFYAVSICAIPLALLLVIRPGWRLAVEGWRGDGRIRAALAPILALPSAAVLLWGVYCAAWLAILTLKGDF